MQTIKQLFYLSTICFRTESNVPSLENMASEEVSGDKSDDDEDSDVGGANDEDDGESSASVSTLRSANRCVYLTQ